MPHLFGTTADWITSATRATDTNAASRKLEREYVDDLCMTRRTPATIAATAIDATPIDTAESRGRSSSIARARTYCYSFTLFFVRPPSPVQHEFHTNTYTKAMDDDDDRSGTGCCFIRALYAGAVAQNLVGRILGSLGLTDPDLIACCAQRSGSFEDIVRVHIYGCTSRREVLVHGSELRPNERAGLIARLDRGDSLGCTVVVMGDDAPGDHADWVSCCPPGAVVSPPGSPVLDGGPSRLFVYTLFDDATGEHTYGYLPFYRRRRLRCVDALQQPQQQQQQQQQLQQHLRCRISDRDVSIAELTALLGERESEVQAAVAAVQAAERDRNSAQEAREAIWKERDALVQSSAAFRREAAKLRAQAEDARASKARAKRHLESSGEDLSATLRAVEEADAVLEAERARLGRALGAIADAAARASLAEADLEGVEATRSTLEAERLASSRSADEARAEKVRLMLEAVRLDAACREISARNAVASEEAACERAVTDRLVAERDRARADGIAAMRAAGRWREEIAVMSPLL